MDSINARKIGRIFSRFHVPMLFIAIMLAPAATFISGCHRSLSDSERQSIANAYAEMLIAKNMYRNDSTLGMRASDSISRAFGFDDESDLRARIELLTEEPESLRKMLDSAQHRLERIQNGTDTLVRPGIKK